MTAALSILPPCSCSHYSECWTSFMCLSSYSPSPYLPSYLPSYHSSVSLFSFSLLHIILPSYLSLLSTVIFPSFTLFFFPYHVTPFNSISLHAHSHTHTNTHTPPPPSAHTRTHRHAILFSQRILTSEGWGSTATILRTGRTSLLARWKLFSTGKWKKKKKKRRKTEEEEPLKSSRKVRAERTLSISLRLSLLEWLCASTFLLKRCSFKPLLHHSFPFLFTSLYLYPFLYFYLNLFVFYILFQHVTSFSFFYLFSFSLSSFPLSFLFLFSFSYSFSSSLPFSSLT